MIAVPQCVPYTISAYPALDLSRTLYRLWSYPAPDPRTLHPDSALVPYTFPPAYRAARACPDQSCASTSAYPTPRTLHRLILRHDELGHLYARRCGPCARGEQRVWPVHDGRLGTFGSPPPPPRPPRTLHREIPPERGGGPKALPPRDPTPRETSFAGGPPGSPREVEA